jgi:hypothetical protein
VPHAIPSFAGMIGLVRAADLAAYLGFEGTTDAFRTFCAEKGIKPIRKGWYDPHHVRARLNAVQGLTATPLSSEPTLSLVEQRRARLGAA